MEADLVLYDKFLSPTGRHLHESAIRRMGTVAARSADMVSFAAGYPDPASFPWGELRELAADLLSGADPTVLQYGPTRGHEPLIEAIVELLAARHIIVTPPQVTITTGSQQGIDLVGRVLVTPGDVVLVELPAYTGAISAFKNAQARLVGVRQDDDGIDLEDLDAVCLRERRAGHRVNLLYLVPNFQNPTGLLLGLDKRQRLLEWVERCDMLIVEDDPYGALYFDDVARAEDTRPIRADDTRGRVIYLSTFSKTLAPGFRVGWVVAPAALIERFDTAKQSIDLMTGSLDQRIVHEAVRRGVLDRLAPDLRRLYRTKRDAMEQALREELGGHLRWLPPKGGFFLWATLPDGVEDETLLARALEERLVFVAGSAFYVDGTGHDRIRLSFSAPAVDRIREGARRLAAAMAANVVRS
ncbi:MAG: PLP-dependent aminotransferase family protein [Acidobacteria bacterium]|nr:PLP-dependent aminotransferase family protein [Acidobacteriota bacterium]